MRVFSIIRKLGEENLEAFRLSFRIQFDSLCLRTRNHQCLSSLFLSLSRRHTYIHTARRRKLLANANSHTGIALFRLRVGGARDEGRGGAQDSWFAFAYSSAVLPSTFPATHPPWNSAGTRWCGCMHSLRGMERGGPGDGAGRGHGGRGQQPCISSLDS